MSCETVKNHLKIITDKISTTEQPKEQCNCALDCRRSRKYCSDRIFGICVSHATESWIG